MEHEYTGTKMVILSRYSTHLKKKKKPRKQTSLEPILLIGEYPTWSLKQFKGLRPVEENCYETAFAASHKLK